MLYSTPAHREQLYAGTISNAQARQTLDKLSFSGVHLSSLAKDLQDMDEGSKDAQLQALSQHFKGQTPTQQTSITCMTTIKKAHDEVHLSDIVIMNAVLHVTDSCFNSIHAARLADDADGIFVECVSARSLNKDECPCMTQKVHMHSCCKAFCIRARALGPCLLYFC